MSTPDQGAAVRGYGKRWREIRQRAMDRWATTEPRCLICDPPERDTPPDEAPAAAQEETR